MIASQSGVWGRAPETSTILAERGLGQGPKEKTFFSGVWGGAPETSTILPGFGAEPQRENLP